MGELKIENACIACKHMHGDVSVMSRQPTCMHPDAASDQKNYVTGEWKVNYTRCEDMRSPHGGCRPEGILFEGKTTPYG